MRDADLTFDCASRFSDKNPSVAPPSRFRMFADTDGAASVVLVSGKYLDKIGHDRNKAVQLHGYGHTTDYLRSIKRTHQRSRPRAKQPRKLSAWPTSSRATCKAPKCTIAFPSLKLSHTKFSDWPIPAKVWTL